MSHVSVVQGDRTLPPGFDHPHASEEARAIAEAGLILRVQVGSGVHGTAVTGQDDRDEMGISAPVADLVGCQAPVAGLFDVPTQASRCQGAKTTISKSPTGLGTFRCGHDRPCR